MPYVLDAKNQADTQQHHQSKMTTNALKYIELNEKLDCVLCNPPKRKLSLILLKSNFA